MDLSGPAVGSHVEAGVVEHPAAGDFAHARALPTDRTWFKRAVFYEVLVRAFYGRGHLEGGDLPTAHQWPLESQDLELALFEHFHGGPCAAQCRPGRSVVDLQLGTAQVQTISGGN